MQLELQVCLVKMKLKDFQSSCMDDSCAVENHQVCMVKIKLKDGPQLFAKTPDSDTWLNGAGGACAAGAVSEQAAGV